MAAHPQGRDSNRRAGVMHNTKVHNPQPLQPILLNLFSAFDTIYNRGPLSTVTGLFSASLNGRVLSGKVT